MKLAEYISTQTDNDLSEISSTLTDLIANELTSKLDPTNLDLNNDVLDIVHATTKLIFKNLRFIINTMVSNIDNVSEIKPTE